MNKNIHRKTTPPSTFSIGMLAAALVCYANWAQAEWQHSSRFSTEHNSNSSDYNKDSIGYIYESRDRTDERNQQDYFSLEINHHDIEDGGRLYDGDQIRANGGKWLTSTSYVEAHIGADRLKETRRAGSRSESETVYAVKVHNRFSEHMTATLQHEKSLPYLNGITENEKGEMLTMRTDAASIEVRPSGRSRLEARIAQRRLSDGNRARAGNIGAHYGLSAAGPEIWVGLEASGLDYADKDEAYWTPRNHRAMMVSVTADVPLSEHLYANAYASAGRSTDDEADEYSNDYLVVIGTNYRASENLVVEARLQSGRSQQDNEEFKERGGALAVTFSHL